MVYWLQEEPPGIGAKNAGSKARLDIARIFQGHANAVPVVLVPSKQEGYRMHLSNAVVLRRTIKAVDWQRGDVLVVQYPLFLRTVASALILKQLRRKGVRLIVLIHDIMSLRHIRAVDDFLKVKAARYMDEGLLFQNAEKIIVHNFRMRAYLASCGVPEEKMVDLELFDYLYDGQTQPRGWLENPEVIIAGNLMREKTGYLYELPEAPVFRLYGTGYSDEKASGNIRYHGSFTPEELPGVLQGNFGLVWDGPTVTTCAGSWGEYTKYNNPHKASLYIAAGLPLIVWKEAAVAALVEREKIGIAVDSLEELKDLSNYVGKEEYEDMLQNVRRLSEKVRSGEFFLRALNRALEI